MKTKLFYFVAIMIGMMYCTTVSAQDNKQLLKEQKAIMKQAAKDAKKQVKELKKDGWKVAVGAKPMESQLTDLFVMEHGIRKALNLGHTFGHAFESWALTRRPYLHGYAVAWGLICELYLSVIKTGFPTEKMRQTVRFIKENYGDLPITCDDYPELYAFMTHDKKNEAGIINFTLLGEVGDIRINQTATKEEIYETLDFFREG